MSLQDNPSKIGNVATIDHFSGSVGPTFNNPALAYITRLGSPGSKKTMLSTLRIIAEMLGFGAIADCPWHELKRPHVQQIISNLTEKGLSPATLNIYLSAIKGVCEEAWMLSLMTADDYQKIYKIKSARGSRIASGRALERDEVTALITSCSLNKTNAGIRDTAIIMLLFGCGLRKDELINLKVEDINWKENCFTVIGKGNKQAKCFMPEEASKALYNWLVIRGYESGFVFIRILKNDTLKHNPLTGQGITYILKKHGSKAIIDDFAPHDTRRTFATRMFESGADALVVMAAMRHSNLSTTQRYDFRGEKTLKDASKNVNFFS